MVDLHIHSTASDGSLSPRDIPPRGVSCSLHAIALTDHDSVAGIPEFLESAAACGIPALAGVELDTQFEFTDLHILGYGIDIRNQALLEALAWIRENRTARNQRMLDKLSTLGYPLELSDVLEFAADPETAGRPHVAQAMVKRGYVHDIREAFDRFLGDGKPGDVPRTRLSATEGIQLIRNAGGIAIWAHPRAKFSGSSLRKITPILAAAGLEGLEAYYSNYTPTKMREVLRVAKEMNLLVTGGSDFHGTCKPDISLGRGMGNLRVPDECWAHLLERLNTRNR